MAVSLYAPWKGTKWKNIDLYMRTFSFVGTKYIFVIDVRGKVDLDIGKYESYSILSSLSKATSSGPIPIGMLYKWKSERFLLKTIVCILELEALLIWSHTLLG